MTIKQTLVASALFCGMSLSAAEPVLTGNDRGLEIPQLSLRKKLDQKNAFKFKKSAFSGSGREWEQAEVTGGGLFLNVGIHFPSDKYMDVDGLTSAFYDYKMGYDFEFGSYFRFAKLQDGLMGIGLRVTWLSASYTRATSEIEGVKPIHVLELSPVKVGPQFGLAINEEMGVDVYYQLGYNFTSVVTSTEGLADNEDIGIYWGYQGISHEVGASFHYKIFNLGLGYRLGKVKNFTYTYDGETDNDLLDDEKRSVNNFRITLGLKF